MHLRYVDTHCHLTNTEFASDVHEVIEEAEKEGIAIVCSATTPDEWTPCLELASEYRWVYPSAGLDPMLYDKLEDTVTWIHANSPNLVAIGEVGIDHYIVRDHNERNRQEETFKNLIALSIELGLPLQVHSRSGGRRALEVLYGLSAENVHMHAFDGKASLARVASDDYGYYFSIPTSVVRSQQKRKLVRAVNIERLLLETDSPVLGPERGERNSPLNIHVALDEVAGILRRDPEEIREIVMENTLRLYKRINYL